MARLSLTGAERLALADVGVTVEPSGILRGDDGAEVGPGIAAMLLKTDRHPGTGRFVPAADPAIIPAVHPAEADDFRRGWLDDGQQAEPPGTLPPASPYPGGSPAADVYAAAAEALTRNVRSADDDRMTPYRAIPDDAFGTARPVPDHQIPSDMRARAIPSPRATDMTRAAPGEIRD